MYGNGEQVFCIPAEGLDTPNLKANAGGVEIVVKVVSNGDTWAGDIGICIPYADTRKQLVVLGHLTPCSSHPEGHVGRNPSSDVWEARVRDANILGTGIAFDIESAVDVGEGGVRLSYYFHLRSGERLFILADYSSGEVIIVNYYVGVR